MTRSATAIARGSTRASSRRPSGGSPVSTNLALVRGVLVALPTVRVVDRHQRATTFDVATVVKGRRQVVPVVAINKDLPIVKVGDELTALGHIRRRFFRSGGRTQSITELVAEHVSCGGRGIRLERLYQEVTNRVRQTRSTRMAADTTSV